MKATDYLIYAAKRRCYTERAWIVSCFAMTPPKQPNEPIDPDKAFPGMLIREVFGCFYLDDDLNRHPLEIDPSRKDKPIFHKYDKLTLSPSDFPFIGKDPIETTVGRFILNMVTVFEPFYGRLPYINRAFTPSVIENIIAKSYHDTLPMGQEKESGKFYVDEGERFSQAVNYLEQFSKIFSGSVTRAGVLPPPGRKEFMKELLKRYEGKLSDPIEMVKFQTEVSDFDLKYLKETDPDFMRFANGKILEARVKAYLTQGGEINEFADSMKMTPILTPLEDGISLSPDQFVAAANTVRYGSFSRGAETVNGGVVAKALQNALDTWRITSDDCGTKLGINHQYHEDEVNELVGRYVILGGKPVLVSDLEQAKAFADKSVMVRSPQYCLKIGTESCEICSGQKLSKYRDGQIIPAMEVSAGIMNDSLKKMHSTKASSKDFILSNIIS